MKGLNSKILQEFLKVAAKEIKGEWLLVGGTLLPAVGLDVRSTVDIDLIGLGEKEKLQNLELMTIAESLGLSVESINQAAEFFLAKIKYTKSDLIPLKKGKQSTIFRPSAALYLKLKIPRLTDSDYLDCVHYFNYCRGQGDFIDAKSVQSALTMEMKKKPTEERMNRLAKLKGLLS